MAKADSVFCAQACIVGIPDANLGEAIYAVARDLNGKTDKDIIEHVDNCLGDQYALDGVLALKELGLLEFPVNRTFKIVKRSIQEAVVRCLGGLTS